MTQVIDHRPPRTPTPSGLSQDASHSDKSPAPKASTFSLAVLGSLLLWAAVPPLDLWPLAWVVPIPWLLLVRRDELAGRRPYQKIYAAGVVYWLLAIHWIRLPHPANHLGLIALAGYLGVYWPLFIGLSRIAVHRLRVPLVLAAPVVWTGLELARGHVLGGFLMGELGHTQYHFLQLIQIADLGGAYLVSFMVMMGAAGLVCCWPWRGVRSLAPIAISGAVLAAAILYGSSRLAIAESPPIARAALIQGSIDATWKADPGKAQRILNEYDRLTVASLQEAGDLDLIVWPETMYTLSLVEFEEGYALPPDVGDKASVELYAADIRDDLTTRARSLDTPLLMGMESRQLRRDGIAIRNSAAFIQADGTIAGRYDKTHLVMFGEYIPLARQFPIIYQLTPLPGGLEPGTEPQSFQTGGVQYGPNICYESVLPHLIRRQVAELAAQGREPDVLVNLTNDAWFWGSSELDMHLVCSVFRAIENRKPVLIAANSGLSAQIDPYGRIVQQSTRRQSEYLIAEVSTLDVQSSYAAWGDWPAGICLLACCGFALVGGWSGRKGRSG